VEVPETLFPRGLLHSPVVAHILVQKFGRGVPHYRLEQHILDQGFDLERGNDESLRRRGRAARWRFHMHAMWQDAIQSAAIIATDTTGAVLRL
jgi:hypothetical protein